MSYQLPDHLSPRAVSSTFARALHAPAFVLLGGCLVSAVGLQAQVPDARVWPAIAAAVAMIVLLAVLDRWRTTLVSLAYLVLGGLAAYGYIHTLATQFAPSRLSDNFIVVLPAAALIMVGGSGAGALAGLRWSAAGFIVAQTVSFGALLQARGEADFPLPPLAVYVGISLVLCLNWFGRRADWRAQPRLGRAERDEYLAAIRRRAEIESAALVHDTILNHLAVIASSPSGPPSAALYDQLEMDVAALSRVDLGSLEPRSTPAAPGTVASGTATRGTVGTGTGTVASGTVAPGTDAGMGIDPDTDPASDAPLRLPTEFAATHAPTPSAHTPAHTSTPAHTPAHNSTAAPAPAHTPTPARLSPHLSPYLSAHTRSPHRTQELLVPSSWQRTPLFGAIEQARQRGLSVRRTGDPVPVAQLTDAAATALGLAVTECLTNVQQHSGVTEVEVAIDASDTDLVVLVIDAGSGFTPGEVPHDRLGIKNSVRGRIEAAHGTVTVWSSPGEGTSVILRLPLDRAEVAL